MKLLYEFKHKVPSTGEIVTLAVRKPTRRELDEADMDFSAFQSECIKRGILTKEMMVKSYKEFGGSLSNGENKEYQKLVENFLVLSNKIDSETDEKKRADLEGERMTYFRTIQDVESEQERLFDRTADVIARNKTLLSLVLLLSIKKVDGLWQPIYEGVDYDDRYESFSTQEETEYDDAHNLLGHLTLIVSFWYFGEKDIKYEDFASYEKMSDYAVDEEKTEEVVEAVAKTDDEPKTSDGD